MTRLDVGHSERGDWLPPEQRAWVRGRVALWLRTKFKHEPRGLTVHSLRAALAEAERRGLEDSQHLPWSAIPGVNQLDPDAWHSALLDWLLAGFEPLPDPPPVENSYPVYPWPEG